MKQCVAAKGYCSNSSPNDTCKQCWFDDDCGEEGGCLVTPDALCYGWCTKNSWMNSCTKCLDDNHCNRVDGC